MKKIFQYNVFNDATLDGIVKTCSLLAEKYMDGKSDTREYKEANAEVTNTFMKYCVEQIPNAKFNSIEDVKSPMVHNNMFFLQAFDTVMAQIYTPAIPAVISRNYENFWDIQQVGWGKLRPAC